MSVSPIPAWSQEPGLADAPPGSPPASLVRTRPSQTLEECLELCAFASGVHWGREAAGRE